MSGGWPRRADFVDTLLVVLFLVGIYLNLTIVLARGLPLTAALAGIAGIILLGKHARRIQQGELVALFCLILLYLLSILFASDYKFLEERFKGFVQLSYSLVICYGFYLVLVQYERNRLAHIFLMFALAIALGAALENYAGMRGLSDSVRSVLYNAPSIYEADRRDILLYGQIRPKVFTSEPSSVTFAYTLFAFSWYVLSTWRLKLLGYFAALAAGYFLMRGPTLLLGVLLLGPYHVFLATRAQFAGRAVYNIPRLFGLTVFGILLIIAFAAVATTLYAERFSDVTSGADPSFFFRVIGPLLVAVDVIKQFPIAGAGLTGEESIAETIIQAYVSSPYYSTTWGFSDINNMMNNYFWNHWVYLGLFWGVVICIGLGAWLRKLGTPSLMFCFGCWSIMGQASGAYVSPMTWFVMILAAALGTLHYRQPASQLARPSHPVPGSVRLTLRQRPTPLR